LGIYDDEIDCVGDHFNNYGSALVDEEEAHTKNTQFKNPIDPRHFGEVEDFLVFMFGEDLVDVYDFDQSQSDSSREQHYRDKGLPRYHAVILVCVGEFQIGNALDDCKSADGQQAVLASFENAGARVGGEVT